MIWDEKLWFPESFAGRQYGWEDLRNSSESNIYKPQLADIKWTVALGALFVALRYILGRVVFKPLGNRLGIRDEKLDKNKNPFLETVYQQEEARNGKTNTTLKNINGVCAAKLNGFCVNKNGVRATEKSKTVSTDQSQATSIEKFCKSGWQLLYYTTIVIYGLIVLWDKPWFWHTSYCFEDWPFQNVTDGMYCYYMMEIAFYWSLLFTLAQDSKKANYTETLIHHAAALILLYFSWIMNYVRFGCLVMFFFDISDPFLEVAKLCTYLKKPRAADIFFSVFVILWIVTCFIVLPYAVVYVTTFVYFDYASRATIPYIMLNMFIYVELALTAIWTYRMYKWIMAKLKKSE